MDSKRGVIKMYKNAKYYKDIMGNIAGIQVEIDDVISCVPINLDNTDYANIMALVDAGELIIAEAETS
jgi:hypothetical protein